jgi:molybdenum cofactor cytidylyltransferase
MPNIQLLLIAAGASKRMGQPKQLLAWGNESLVEHQIKVLLETENSLSVVLGAYSDKIIPIIEKFPVAIYLNADWKKGMGTSIAYGIKKMLEKESTADGILISLIDQPLITSIHFKKMLKLFQPGKDQIIVSNSNDGWSGAPVLFDATYFKELLKLKGDEGAKVIVRKYRNSAKLIDTADILKDIDTYESYLKLKP